MDGVVTPRPAPAPCIQPSMRASSPGVVNSPPGACADLDPPAARRKISLDVAHHGQKLNLPVLWTAAFRPRRSPRRTRAERPTDPSPSPPLPSKFFPIVSHNPPKRNPIAHSSQKQSISPNPRSPKPPPSRSPSRRRPAGWTPNRNKKPLSREGFLGRGRGGGISFFEKKSLPRKNIAFYSQSLFSAASKATSEGSKFTLWVKSQASLAPNMRSMPESSHSTQSGPW